MAPGWVALWNTLEEAWLDHALEWPSKLLLGHDKKKNSNSKKEKCDNRMTISD